ncbi:MAG TPA: amylo-alpha-1,6-glucosidase [Xanthobacteraceae bacterium]|nr:amylo-alpha-1,6-glucosidase [Xanthobacteraceae bacterium]
MGSIAEHLSEVPFYIPATGSSTRPRYVLKCDDEFMVLDSHGDIGATAGGPDGLFYCDTRYLSRLELLFNGVPPLLLGSNIRDDNSVFNVDLTNPDIYGHDRIVIPKDTLHIVRTMFLWRACAYQRLGLHNHGEEPIEFDLTLVFGNDFADVFEVRGLKRERRGVARSAVHPPQQVLYRYEGLDRKIRRTSVRFDPPPTQLDQHAAHYRVVLPPKECLSIFLVVGCNRPEHEEPIPFFSAMSSERHALRRAAQGAAAVETSNDIFNEVICRSVGDLYMLMTETPQGPFPYAGIPWYSTSFGRDGLIAALEMLWLDPSIARGVLKRLAALQAKHCDDEADAQPGKILHEMRSGEMAVLKEVPFELYYGSVDSTPLFVLLAGLYAERTGDYETLAELWPAIEAALRWIDGPGDVDGDGFIEYSRATEQGLSNQGWKDSFDAVFHADGNLAEGPIAIAEVQGYVYAAKRLAARCALRFGNKRRAAELEQQAELLKQQFNEFFWCNDIGTYALALDGRKQGCCVRTSNAGQLLFTGIVSPERAVKVAEQLMQPQFFSGWGVRTVSSAEYRYNPMSYHNGSIWPHDNALIALGLARYGLMDGVEKIFESLFTAATYMESRRLPELYCGFQRRRGRGPTLYPVACSPQAWASAAPLALIQASLGLEFDPERNEIRLRNPRLPPFLDKVRLSNLQLGKSSVELAVYRHGDRISVEVKPGQGSVQVGIV